MKITPVSKLVAAAERQIKTLRVDEVVHLLNEPGITICDIRDVRELWQNGKIRGARHTPRGMLEFWADPASPYYRSFFGDSEKTVLYCAMSWRSALAAKTLQDMGYNNVYHIGGGYEAWQKAELETESVGQK